MGTGASRIREPLPAWSGSGDPASGSPVARKRWMAALVAMPMSKQLPVELQYPHSYQLA